MATFFKVECMIQCPSDWDRRKAVVFAESLLSSQAEKDTLYVEQVTEAEFTK